LQPTNKELRKVATASVIGATIEWYDFFLYGIVASIVFNKLYFPAGDPTVNTLLAYATFAVGFVARPLGGIIFGHFGDKIGRKSMLVLTLMIMGVSNSLLIREILLLPMVYRWARNSFCTLKCDCDEFLRRASGKPTFWC